MQIPSSKLASETLIGLGRYFLGSIKQDEQTKHLALVFEPTQADLIAAFQARVAADVALLEPRIVVRFAKWSLEQILRAIAAQTHILDDCLNHGKAYDAVFPKGLDAEIRPRRAFQVEAAKAVHTRLMNQPAAKKLAEAYGDKLAAATMTFAEAEKTYQAARVAIGLARAKEDGARESWVAAYDSCAGTVRSLFPRNKSQQDLFFDTFRIYRAPSSDASHTISRSETVRWAKPGIVFDPANPGQATPVAVFGSVLASGIFSGDTGNGASFPFVYLDATHALTQRAVPSDPP